MYFFSEFFPSEPRLIKPACGSSGKIFADQRICLPDGVCLLREEDLAARFFGGLFQDCEIFGELFLVDEKVGSLHQSTSTG